MIEEILKVSFMRLKKVKSGNFKSVKEELDMLGIDYSEDDLFASYQVSKESNSLEEALKLIKTNTDNYATQAKNAFKNEKEKKEKLIQEKKEAEAKKKERKQEIEEQAEAFNYLRNITDYKICGGTSMYDLQSKVREEMRSGYVPYGGVSTYNPGGKIGGVPDSFFQAVVMFD